MAGEWMPVRLDLHEDPAVVAIAKTLGKTENEVVGGIMRVWGWFFRQSRAGRAPVTPAYLDCHARVTGLCAEMERVGWLNVRDADGCEVPKWNRWFTNSAKKRLNAARRQRAKRERDRHAGVTPPSRKERDASVTTGQDRTVAKEPLPLAEQGAAVADATVSNGRPGRDAALADVRAIFLERPDRRAALIAALHPDVQAAAERAGGFHALGLMNDFEFARAFRAAYRRAPAPRARP